MGFKSSHTGTPAGKKTKTQSGREDFSSFLDRWREVEAKTTRDGDGGEGERKVLNI